MHSSLIVGPPAVVPNVDTRFADRSGTPLLRAPSGVFELSAATAVNGGASLNHRSAGSGNSIPGLAGPVGSNSRDSGDAMANSPQRHATAPEGAIVALVANAPAGTSASASVQASSWSARGGAAHGVPPTSTSNAGDMPMGGSATYGDDDSRDSLFLFTPHHPFRVACAAVLEHPYFRYLLLACILGDSALMGLAQPLAPPSAATQRAMNAMDTFFLCMYTLECALGFIARGVVLDPGAYLRNPMALLDVVIILAGVGDRLWGNTDAHEPLRVLRLLRPLRILQGSAHMNRVTRAVVRALPNVLHNLFLCLYVIVVFGIAGVQLWRGRLAQRCYITAIPDEPPASALQYLSCAATDVTAVANGGIDVTSRIASSAWAGALLPLTLPALVGNDTNFCGGAHLCASYGATLGIETQCMAHRDLYFRRNLNYDNILTASLVALKVMTMPEWQEEMDLVTDADGALSALYFVGMTLLGSFIVLNVFFAILTLSYSHDDEGYVFVACQGTQVDEAMLDSYEVAARVKRGDHSALTAFRSTAKRNDTAAPTPTKGGAAPRDEHTQTHDDDSSQRRRPHHHAVVVPGSTHHPLDGSPLDDPATEEQLTTHQTATSTSRADGSGRAPVRVRPVPLLRQPWRVALLNITEGRPANMLFAALAALIVVMLAVDWRGIDNGLHGGLETVEEVVVTLFMMRFLLFAAAIGPRAVVAAHWFRAALEVLLFVFTFLSRGGAIGPWGRGFSALRIFSIVRHQLLFSIGAQGLFPGGNSFVFLAFITLIVIYIYANIGMLLFGTRFDAADATDARDSFDRLWQAFVTIFVSVFGTGWSDLMLRAMSVSHNGREAVAVIFFVSLLVVGRMILLNLSVAVVFDALRKTDPGAANDELLPPVLLLPPMDDMELHNRNPHPASGDAFRVGESTVHGLHDEDPDDSSDPQQQQQQQQQLESAQTSSEPGHQQRTPGTGGVASSNTPATTSSDAARGVGAPQPAAANVVTAIPATQQPAMGQPRNLPPLHPASARPLPVRATDLETGSTTGSITEMPLEPTSAEKPLYSQFEFLGAAPLDGVALTAEIALQEQVRLATSTTKPGRRNPLLAPAEGGGAEPLPPFIFLDPHAVHESAVGAWLRSLAPRFRPRRFIVFGRSCLSFTSASPLRQAAARLVASPYFSVYCDVAIAINVLQLLFVVANPTPERQRVLLGFDVAFAVLFTFELLCNGIAFGFFTPGLPESMVRRNEELLLRQTGGESLNEHAKNVLVIPVRERTPDEQALRTNLSSTTNSPTHPSLNVSFGSSHPSVPQARGVAEESDTVGSGGDGFMGLVAAPALPTNVGVKTAGRRGTPAVGSGGRPRGSPVTKQQPHPASRTREMPAGTDELPPIVMARAAYFRQTPAHVVDALCILLGCSLQFAFPWTRAFRAARSIRLLVRFQEGQVLMEAFARTIPPLLRAMVVAACAFVAVAIIQLKFFKGIFWTCSDSTAEVQQMCAGYSSAVGLDALFPVRQNVTRVWRKRDYSFDNFGQSMFVSLAFALGDGLRSVVWDAVDSTVPGRSFSAGGHPERSVIVLASYLFLNMYVTKMLIAVLMRNYILFHADADGSARLSHTQRLYLRTRHAIAETVDDALIPRSRRHAGVIHRALTYRWELFTTRVSLWDAAVLLAVLLNMIMLAVAHEGMTDNVADAGLVCTYVVLGMLIVEAAAKVLAYGAAQYAVNGWHMIDCAIIICGLVDVAFGGTNRVCAALRVVRALRLIRGTQVEETLRMLSRNFRAFVGIVFLLILCYVVFAIAGVHLFGPWAASTHFRDVGEAVSTLYSASTASSWRDMLSDTSSVDCSDGGPCEARVGALVFYIVFNIIVSFAVVKLFVAVIVDIYLEHSNVDDPVREGFVTLRRLWRLRFPDGTQSAQVEHVVHLLERAPREVTDLPRHPTNAQALRLLSELNVAVEARVHAGGVGSDSETQYHVYYRDVVFALAFRRFKVDVRSMGRFVSDAVVAALYGPHCTAATVYAAIVLQRRWRQVRKFNAVMHQQCAVPLSHHDRHAMVGPQPRPVAASLVRPVASGARSSSTDVTALPPLAAALSSFVTPSSGSGSRGRSGGEVFGLAVDAKNNASAGISGCISSTMAAGFFGFPTSLRAADVGAAAPGSLPPRQSLRSSSASLQRDALAQAGSVWPMDRLKEPLRDLPATQSLEGPAAQHAGVGTAGRDASLYAPIATAAAGGVCATSQPPSPALSPPLAHSQDQAAASWRGAPAQPGVLNSGTTAGADATVNLSAATSSALSLRSALLRGSISASARDGGPMSLNFEPNTDERLLRHQQPRGAQGGPEGSFDNVLSEVTTRDAGTNSRSLDSVQPRPHPLP